eukprot:Gb_24776 [translate_table: standard]
MSAQSHASSSQLMKKHDEALGLLPELRTAIPTVRAVTKQMQLAPIAHASPYLPQPQQKQLALAPRPFHQFQYHVPQQVYPPPLASHGEVVVDRDLFFSTLTKFHVTLGTKLTDKKDGPVLRRCQLPAIAFPRSDWKQALLSPHVPEVDVAGDGEGQSLKTPNRFRRPFDLNALPLERNVLFVKHFDSTCCLVMSFSFSGSIALTFQKPFSHRRKTWHIKFDIDISGNGELGFLSPLGVLVCCISYSIIFVTASKKSSQAPHTQKGEFKPLWGLRIWLLHVAYIYFGNRLVLIHLRIPKIGGRDLDLHLLYKEVTARGGLEMVPSVVAYSAPEMLPYVSEMVSPTSVLPFPGTVHRSKICSGRAKVIPTARASEEDEKDVANANRARGRGLRSKNLHLDYMKSEVPNLELVIHERKWKEITVVLNFPRTTTSASFVLRKYYINLLHHYEKVHFFQVQGPLVPPPVHATNSNPANQIIEVQHTQSALESPETETRKRKIDSAQALGVDPASSIGSIVTGSIDGKHEHGYLVTVMVGTRKMRGVLYHVPPCSTRPQGASVSSFMNSLETDLKTPARVHRMGRKQKKKEMSRKDPNAPRQNRTGYNFFFAEQRAKLKSAQPDKDRAISKMIGNLWNQLSEDEKSPYQDRGLEDKERYRREMREYKERLRLEGQGVVGTTDCQYKERLRLEGQGVARTTDYQNSLHVQRNNDHISNDAVHQVQLRLEGAKSPQDHCQSGSHNGFGVGICDNQSCGSGSALVEDHSINKAQSPKDLNPVPKDENPVMMLEQGAHG